MITALGYQKYHDAAGLEPYVRALHRLEGVPALSAVRELCRPILERAMTTPLPSELETATAKAFERLTAVAAAESYAVPSSATSEDGRAASFAGLYETTLGLRTAGEVVDAVKRCYVALWHPRAVHYRSIKRLGHNEAMAVVVMPLVVAEVSGVAFTRDPVGGTNDVVIEGAWGLGEAVVSGRVTPDRYVVQRRGCVVRSSQVAVKSVMATCREGTTELVETPAHRAEARCLGDEQVQEIAELALRIESFYGVPVDVEWAVDREGNLCVLQARPVTA